MDSAAIRRLSPASPTGSSPRITAHKVRPTRYGSQGTAHKVRLTSRPGGIISWLNLWQQGMSVSLFEFRCAFDAASPFL
jgi:hypothetical protein